jgi:hypothetical protein
VAKNKYADQPKVVALIDEIEVRAEVTTQMEVLRDAHGEMDLVAYGYPRGRANS